MNRSVLFVIAGAFSIAIIVAILVQMKLAPKDSAEDVVRTEILVATKDIAVGAKLQRSDVRWQSWPADAVYKGVYQKKDLPEGKLDMVGEMVRRPIVSGEPILQSAIIPDSKKGSMMSARLEPGMRAMTVRVAAETSVGGFAGPGDHVDVLMTYSVRTTGSLRDATETVVNRMATQTLLTKVRVLAIDQSAKEEGTREAKVGKTATLEVTPKQAEVLAMGMEIGDLHLILRRIGETEELPSTAPLTTDLSVSDLVQRVNKSLRNNSTSGGTVRVYEGGTIVNMPVRRMDRADEAQGEQQ